YFEEWDDPMISGIQWVSELIELAGGEECFPELAREGLGRNRIIADPLEVPRRAPDIVLGSWCGKKFQPQRLAARPGWDAIPAVDAQHRLDVRQLEGRDPQCGGDPSDQRPHRAFQTVAGERRAHLDLEEHAQQVRPPAAGASEGGELAAEVECRELAGAEAGDRLAHLRAIEAQLAHDGARGG